MIFVFLQILKRGFIFPYITDKSGSLAGSWKAGHGQNHKRLLLTLISTSNQNLWKNFRQLDTHSPLIKSV